MSDIPSPRSLSESENDSGYSYYLSMYIMTRSSARSGSPQSLQDLTVRNHGVLTLWSPDTCQRRVVDTSVGTIISNLFGFSPP